MSAAADLQIRIVFVPKGGTSIYQPLDRRVFGALKAKGTRSFLDVIHEMPNAPCTRELAVRVLLACWDEIGEHVLQSAWDFNSTGDDNEERSESDDPDFRLPTDDSGSEEE
jgi:hypothetical protein